MIMQLDKETIKTAAKNRLAELQKEALDNALAYVEAAMLADECDCEDDDECECDKD